MKQRRYRALFGVLVALAFVFLGAVATSAPASATARCSGTITWASSLQKEPRAQLVVYYNSSDGGTNSACMYHAGSTYGKRLKTEVQISRCEVGTVPDTWCFTDRTSKTASAYYAYHAGPVGVTGTANRCVIAWGTIILANGGLVRIDSPTVGCP